MTMAMTRGERPKVGLMAISSLLQCEKAARATQQRERRKEEEENMYFLLAFFSMTEERQEVTTLTDPTMTDASKGERVRPESARTGAMKTTRVATPVYWPRKNKPPDMARERRKGLDLRMASLSKISGGLSLVRISCSSASQFQEVPRTQMRLALAFSR